MMGRWGAGLNPPTCIFHFCWNFFMISQHQLWRIHVVERDALSISIEINQTCIRNVSQSKSAVSDHIESNQRPYWSFKENKIIRYVKWRIVYALEPYRIWICIGNVSNICVRCSVAYLSNTDPDISLPKIRYYIWYMK
jgi:hypothetical protein